MKGIWQVIFFFAIATLPVLSGAQSQKSKAPDASPEMSRLAKMFVGDWNTVENMERGDFFPNGGERHGITHWRMGAGGTTLIGEGHSNGSAGELSYLMAIWWDGQASIYRLFTCFNDPKAPCTLRGTAHWEGETFVNDYEEMANGEMKKFRDTFTQTSPNSRSLVAAIETSDDKWKALITTKSTRK